MSPSAPLFIVNPTAGGGRTSRRWGRLAQAIVAAGIEPEALFTEAPGHGSDLARDAIRDGRTTLVAVGGDGTVNEIVSAVLGAGASEDVRIGTIGMGTGKDVAKCLGIGRASRAINVLAGGHERRIDAGRVSCHEADGSRITRFFILEASAGWVPEISQSVPRLLKRLGDTAPYLVMTAIKMLGPMSRQFSVDIDGHNLDGIYNTISIHNMELWGGDLVAAPGAAPDDGLFDAICWGDLGRLAVVRAVQGQKRGGRHVEMDGVHRYPARAVDLDAEKPTRLDLDGEFGGYLPAHISILPGVVRFLAPVATSPGL